MSSSSSTRPIYVKKRNGKKRHRGPERLHGAFTGGFSAGHFNTVGSKGGWKPSDTDGIEAEEEEEEVEEEEEEQQQKYQRGFGTASSASSSSSVLFKSKKKRKRTLIQKPEDFMDEEDANEWGGPVKVKDSYQRSTSHHDRNDGDNVNYSNSNNSNIKTKRNDNVLKDSSSLRTLLYSNKRMKHGTGVSSAIDSVGKQLLKVLGWREGRDESENEANNSNSNSNSNNNSNRSSTKSYAYVALDDGEVVAEETLLSSKGLKRIEMQNSSSLSYSTRDRTGNGNGNGNGTNTGNGNGNDFMIRIPPPKTDTYGMGYEPYKNAPEFKAHREMRKKRAEERARAAASSDGGKRMNVYSMSSLGDEDYDGDGDGNKHKKTRDKQKGGGGGGGGGNDDGGTSNILAYETMEDFIGTKGVGGFALHDDDDQVYDHSAGQSASLFNRGGERSKINTSEYHNEVFEGSDSEVEDELFPFAEKNASGGTITTTRKDKTNSQIESFTGALSAWASVGDTTATSTLNDTTKNAKAVTSDGEAPLAGFELGGSDSNTTQRYPGPDVPADYVVKRHIFSSSDAMSTMKELSSIMKRELKSKSKSLNDINASTKKRDMLQPIAGKSFAGLSNALKNRFTSSKTKQNDSNNSKELGISADPRNIKVTRTIISWQPSHLLLKRFNVKADRYKITANSDQSQDRVQNNNNNKLTTMETREEAFFRKDVLGQLQTTVNNRTSNESELMSLEKQSLSAETVPIERPSLELMRSIFEASSDDDDDDEDEEKGEESLCKSTVEENMDAIREEKALIDIPKDKDTDEGKLSERGDQCHPSAQSFDHPKKVHDELSDASSSRKRKKSRKKSSKSRSKKRKKSKSKRK